MKIKRQDIFYILVILYMLNQVFSESQLIEHSTINILLKLSRFIIIVMFTFYASFNNFMCKKKQFLILFFLIISMMVNMLLFEGGNALFAIIMVTWASRGCSLVKIYKSCILSLFFGYLFICGLCMFGLLEDVVSVRYIGDYLGGLFSGKYLRHSMGFLVHNQIPTTFAILCLLLIIMKKNEISIIETAVILIFNALLFPYFGSRIVFVLINLTFVIYWIMKMFLKLTEKHLYVLKNKYEYFIYPVFSILSFILVLAYNQNNRFMASLNLLFNNRLSMAKYALQNYGFTLFGLGKEAGTYNDLINNTVDNGYILLFIQRGIIISIIVILLYSYLSGIAARKHNIYLQLALVVLAAENMINSHLLTYKLIPLYCILFNSKDIMLEPVSYIRKKLRKNIN